MEFIKNIIGIDEVGKGAIAGPVVAAAVIFLDDIEEILEKLQVNDSKTLSQAKREFIASELILMKNKILYGIGIASNEEIDSIGIVPATAIAMKQSIAKLKNYQVMIDGNYNYLHDCNIEVITIVKGDSKCYNIAAASIIAKVYRDNLMSNIEEDTKKYEWQKNKGYGTKEHINKISFYGFSNCHRRSFCKNLKNV